MPELAKQVSIGASETLLAKADYFAVEDAVLAGKHVVTDCGLIDVPDDASWVTLWVDRTEFPRTDKPVFKHRALQVRPDGSEILLVAQTVRGTEARDRNGNPIRLFKCGTNIPPGKQRRIRVEAILLSDARLEFGVKFSQAQEG